MSQEKSWKVKTNDTLQIRELTCLQRLPVARVMNRLQPESWDVQEAVEQITGCKGWFIARDADNSVAAWFVTRLLLQYRTAEIVTLGVDEGGELELNDTLVPLLERCERWATLQGMANLRLVINSKALSCHNSYISEPGKALSNLRETGRQDYQWLTSNGFQPYGILPNIYGYAYHGVVMIKVLDQMYDFIQYNSS